MKKADNIVYDYKKNEYDAFRKPYPTSFNSKTFNDKKIELCKLETKDYFTSKFLEIKETYDALLQEMEWSTRIENAKYNFTPITGKTYYLYRTGKNDFLSIINPTEWNTEYLGAYKLTSRNTWIKIDSK